MNTTTHDIDIDKFVACLVAASDIVYVVDTTDPLLTRMIDRIERAGWVKSYEERTMLSASADLVRYTDRIADELARGYSPQSAGWVAHTAAKIDEAYKKWTVAVDTIAEAISDLSMIVNPSKADDLRVALRLIAFGPTVD